MPEPGDEIRLYFTTEKEKHGYVISVVHLPVAASQESFAGTAGGTAGGTGVSQVPNPGVSRIDPGHKTIHTVSGKTVDLSENGILLDAGNGMKIELNDQAGILITSPSGVTIRSDASIDISSMQGKVEVTGGEGVEVSQAGSQIQIAGSNVVFHGANAKVQ